MQFENTPPWQKQERALTKYLLQVLCYSLIALGLTSALIAFALVFALTQGMTPADRVQDDVFYALVFGVSTFALWGAAFFLLPKIRMPSRFQPSYGYIPPESLDLPFEVRFYRYFWSRSLDGKGALRFGTDGLVIVGKLEPPILIQGVVICLFVLLWNMSIILRVVGFALIILTFVLLRKRHQSSIAYAQLELIQLDGRIVALRSAQKPSQIAFIVAASDGERLYNELKVHFPSKVLQVMSNTPAG